jgi:hypothetical protein
MNDKRVWEVFSKYNIPKGRSCIKGNGYSRKRYGILRA